MLCIIDIPNIRAPLLGIPVHKLSAPHNRKSYTCNSLLTRSRGSVSFQLVSCFYSMGLNMTVLTYHNEKESSQYWSKSSRIFESMHPRISSYFGHQRGILPTTTIATSWQVNLIKWIWTWNKQILIIGLIILTEFHPKCTITACILCAHVCFCTGIIHPSSKSRLKTNLFLQV